MKTRYYSLTKLLKKDGYVIRPIKGISMLPLLREKTDVVKLILPKGELHVGDVVLYWISPKSYALHRICDIKKDKYIIRGDNCFITEEVSKKRIVAVMDGYYKEGTYIPSDDPEYVAYVKKVLDTGKPLIPDEWLCLIKLYSCAVTGAYPGDILPNINWKRVYALSHKQLIASAISTVIPKLRQQPPAEVCKKFEEAHLYALRREMLFDAERTMILKRFDESGILHIPLKAIILKSYYPQAGMREFSDNDILYDKSRQSDVVDIMRSLGYEVISLESIHDVFNKKPIFNFELHKGLFAEDSPYADFFSDIWSRTVSDTSGCRMSDEDFYLHFVAHYAKHHENSGSGLRQLGDIYLLKKHNEESSSFDRSYVDSSLEKLGLTDFEKDMLSIADDLFVNEHIDDDTLREIMSGGVYGSTANAARKQIKRHGKFGYLVSRVFLPYSSMKALFHILKPLPILLPICWIIRIVKAVVITQKRKLLKEQLGLVINSNRDNK